MLLFFILFWGCCLNVSALSGVPATDHIPEGYKYYAVIDSTGTAKYVYYFKNLPYVYFQKDNDTYMEINTESSILYYSFSSERERDYHLYTEAGYSDLNKSLSAQYNLLESV